MTDKDTNAVDAATLARLWDCGARYVQKLAQQGVAVRVGRGRYNAALSTRNYIRLLREEAAGRGSQEAASANAAFKQTQTELLRLRLERERGEVIAVADAKEVWGAIVRGTRQMILSIPGKFAFETPTLTLHDRSVLERVCRDTLEDAALCRGFTLRPGGSGENEGEDE
jgi:phage terminase Nu1 subunit (DNA packaging protein)